MQIFPVQSRSLYHIELDVHQARYPSSDGVSIVDWTNPTGGPSQHQVPFLQGEVLRYEAQQCRYIEYHIFRVPVLPQL